MQNFRLIESIDICEQLIKFLGSWNFIPKFTVQK
jgi:hypothetical protein